MPTVPVASGNQVSLNPLTNQRFDAPDIGAGGRMIGQAMQRLGSDMGEAAQNLDDAQAIYDEAEAKKADTEYMRLRRERLLGEDGFFTKQNDDAINARPTVEADLAKARGELLAKARSPRARAMLETVLNRRAEEDAEGIARYTLGQVNNFAKVQSAARIQEHKDLYATTFESDPAQARAAKDTILDELRSEADREGWNDPNIINARKIEVLTDMHSSTIKALAMRDVGKAVEYFEQNRDEIAQAEELDLDAMLNPLLVERDASSFADMAEGLATPGEVAEIDTGEGKEPIILALPGSGAVSSGYGKRRHPIDGGIKQHQGLDIKGALGAPVGAAGPGKVVFVGDRKDGYGNRVEIDHGNGYITSYSHLQNGSFKVKVGQQVERGFRVASVGSTGKSTGPHLHFEVAKADGSTYGTRVDPRTVVGKRLAPGGTGGGARASAAGDLASQLEWAETYIPEKLAGHPPRHIASVVEKTKAEIRQRHNERRAIENAAEADQWDAVQESVADMGGWDAVTSTSQIPGFNDLPGAKKNQVLNVVNANLKAAAAGTGSDKRETDYVAYDRYLSMPLSELKQVPIDELQSKLSPGKLTEIIKRRNGGKVEAGKAWTTTGIVTVTKSLLAEAGYATGDSKDARKDAPQVNQFSRRMYNWAVRQKEEIGRWPSEEDIRKQADRFLIETTDGTRAFQVPEGEKVKFEIPSRIRTTIIRALGGRPSEKQIADAYLRGKGIDW